MQKMSFTDQSLKLDSMITMSEDKKRTSILEPKYLSRSRKLIKNFGRFVLQYFLSVAQ